MKMITSKTDRERYMDLYLTQYICELSEDYNQIKFIDSINIELIGMDQKLVNVYHNLKKYSQNIDNVVFHLAKPYKYYSDNHIDNAVKNVIQELYKLSIL